MFDFFINDDVIEQIKVYFSQLKSIQLKTCHFEEWISHNIFPVQCNQLQTLILHCATVAYNPEISIREFILNQSFPQMTNISFENVLVANSPQFFQMNPQILSYEERNCDNSKIQNVVQYLPNIQCLNFTFDEEGDILFENIDTLPQLNSLFLKAHMRETVITSRLNSTSLQNLRLIEFDLGYDATNISELINLKTLHLIDCTLSTGYFVEICKNCRNITEITAQNTTDAFPTDNQLLEIVSHARNLETLTFTDCSRLQTNPFSIDQFMRLAHAVKNRNNTLSVSILNRNANASVRTLTDVNIDLKYTFVEEDSENDENAQDEEIEENQDD